MKLCVSSPCVDVDVVLYYPFPWLFWAGKKKTGWTNTEQDDKTEVKRKKWEWELEKSEEIHPPPSLVQWFAQPLGAVTFGIRYFVLPIRSLNLRMDLRGRYGRLTTSALLRCCAFDQIRENSQWDEEEGWMVRARIQISWIRKEKNAKYSG